MTPNKIKISLIRTAVLKGIKDMQENAGRGIRNLAELGEAQAKSPAQKAFFARVMTVLRQKNNVYYALAQRIANQTNPELLAKFGINLGYNALVHSVAESRKKEKEIGASIPWTLLLMPSEAEGYTMAHFAATLQQGQALGIYAYMVAPPTTRDYEPLLCAMEQCTDCAFLWFLHAGAVDDAMCRRLLCAGNILPVLDLAAAPKMAGHKRRRRRGFCKMPLFKGCL
ncbi:hypothetical protein LJC04_02340 [Ruminococcaceae bacterium OttesenSCG-928-O06]|nr:hypothetical protein [Ruminococcaceae bacterium OttesenSCG-928-O06]